MSQTVRVYKSAAADARLIVRWGRKHARPRGRGRKAWRLLYRVDFSPENLGRPLDGDHAGPARTETPGERSEAPIKEKSS